MMRSKVYFRLGLLTVGAVALALVMLFYLGLAERFATRIRFATIFSESVQGLAVGSPVKYKGVPIGSVSAISIMTQEKLIRVDMKVDPAVFVGIGCGRNGESLDQVYKFCIQEKLDGLRCRLNLSGVTGMRYVEMDYFPDTRPVPLSEIPESRDVIYFASVPSTFDNIVDTVARSLDKISRVDFEGISRGLEKNLSDLNVVLGDPALKRSIARVDRITEHVEVMSKNLSENLTGEELRKIFSGLNRDLDDVNVLIKSLQAKVEDADVSGLVRKFGETADSVRELAETLEQSRMDFNWTLRRVDSLLGNIGELIEFLKVDPSALLRGKNIPPVDFGSGR